MTNSYGTMMPPQDIAYQKAFPVYAQERKPNVLAGALTTSAGAFLGITGASAAVDYFRHRKPVKDGVVSDSYAKKVFEKMVNKNIVAKGKEYCKQGLEVLKGLGKVSNPEEFTKLMKKFKKYTSTLCEGVTFETMLKTVNKDNIQDKVSVLKNKIQASLETEIQNVKDAVKACWNSEQKKFIKPQEIDENFFKIIKNTKNSVNWKKAFKHGGIAAGITGVLTLGYAGYIKYAQAKQLQAMQNMQMMPQNEGQMF